MVSGCDSETGPEVLEAGEDSSVGVKANPVGGDETNRRNDGNEESVEPVHMLMPVTPGNRLVSDVNLLGVKSLSSAKWLIVGGAIRECRSLRGFRS